ncbi:UNVERIFIED_CONTAM: hypothetical protein RMT77_012070 [Armadillidium vulgare]
MESGLRRPSQEDHKNNNVFNEISSNYEDVDNIDVLGSLPVTECYIEDNVLDLSQVQPEEYVDPSAGYEFVNAETGWPSNFDNSEGLLRQLSELGIRVSKDYLTLDLDASDSPQTRSGTASVSTVSEGNSWNEEEDTYASFSSYTEEPESEVVQAEILPNGKIKVSYDNLQKSYVARISSHNNYREFLHLVEGCENNEHDSGEGVDVDSEARIKSSLNRKDSNSKPMSRVDVNVLRKKLISRFVLLKNSQFNNLQEKCSNQIKKLLGEEISYDAMTPDSGVHESFAALTPDEQEKQREEWRSELAKTEDEIQTLRQVLASKVKHAQDLKRRLGITVWREFSEDLSSSFKSVKESQTVQKANEVFEDITGAVTSAPLYQKTAGAIGAVGEKTGAIFGGIGAKFGQLKETPTFKSFEERVGSVYTTAKSKVTGSESNSTQDFEEALREAEAEKAAADAANGTVGTTDTSVVNQTAAS